jgi:hypothetical protein
MQGYTAYRAARADHKKERLVESGGLGLSLGSPQATYGFETSDGV